MMDWYYLKEGRQFGPVSESSIRAWLGSGFLGPDDLVWHGGMSEWTPVAEAPEFGGRAGVGTFPIGPGPLLGSPDSPFGGTVPPPAGVTAYAGFWRRAGAYLIDSLLLSSVVMVLWWPKLSKGMTPEDLQKDLGLLSIEVVLPWLYYALFESAPWQATLGKKAFHLRVVDLEGRRINFLRASLRHFGKVISGLTLFLGYVLAGFSARKQALHDILSSCLVVRE